MSINSALTMSVNSLQVNQLALSVVSNNVANINTAGYSKQRINLGTVSVGSGLSGSAFNQIASNAGVQVTSISRYSNEYLASYHRQQNSGLSFYSTESEIANHITTLMDELSDGGLSQAFDEFYTAATTLQKTPTDATARNNYIQKANNVAILFNAKSKDLTEYRTTLVGDGTESSLKASQSADNVNKINTLLDGLADVNKRIVASGTINSAANNLYDQRDMMLSELSNYMNIDTTIAENGVASVSLGNMDLIKHTKVLNKLEIRVGDDENTRAVVGLVDETGKRSYSDITDKITGGSLGAILEMGGSDSSKLTVQGSLDVMDDLAKGFAEVLNKIQLQGWTKNNVTGEYEPNATGPYAMGISKDANGDTILASPTQPIFITSTGSNNISAGNIKINQALIDDPSGISAAKVEGVAADFEKINPTSDKFTLVDTTARLGVGNGKNIIDVLSTREGTTNSTLKGLSPEEFLMSSISEIGLKSEAIENQAVSQKAICTSVGSQLKSQTSVDLNEELTSMIQFQRSYQASARVFNTCTEILGIMVTLGQ